MSTATLSRPAPVAAPPADRPVSWLAALIGAATLLGGTTALGGVLEGSGWWWPTVEVVGVVVGIGIGARMMRLPTWATMIVQTLALIVTLTALFTTSGYGRVIPNTAVAAEAADLFTSAWQQILGTMPPAPVTTELTFVVAAAVGLAALLVDVTICEAKAPALVALPLLCLYSIPASISEIPLPWTAFVLPAAGYVLLLAVAGHGNRRMGLRSGVSVSLNTVVIGGIAVVAALVAGSAITVVGTEGRIPRNPATSGQVGLSPFTNLAGDLRRGDPVDLLTVTGLNRPEYLRTMALEEWRPNQGWTIGALQSDPDPAPADGVTVTVQSVAFRDRFLPVFSNTSSVAGLSGTWNYDAQLQAWHRPEATNPGAYQFVVADRQPTVSELAADTVTSGGPTTEVGDLPAEVRRLAEQVTLNAAGPFEKAAALQEWFTNPANGFSYSLQVPTGNTGDLLLDFLEGRKGYCEQYASAMAIMLRSIGIPARVAIGFTQGTVDEAGRATINSHDAHAWVEVRFDQAGWVRFDPTPLVNGQGGQQGFTPDEPAEPSSSSSAEPSTSTLPPTVSPTGAAEPSVPQEEIIPTGAAPTNTTGTAAEDDSSWWPLIGLILGSLVVIAAVVTGPGLVRAGRRRRRLALAAGGDPKGAEQAWVEIEDLAVDHGIGVNRAESARVTANRLARKIHLGDHARTLLRSVVTNAEASWYGTPGEEGVSDRSQLGADWVQAVAEVRAGLLQQVRPGPLDRWWPRSLRRSG